MQNLDGELRLALEEALTGSAAVRKACIHRVFAEDGIFSHLTQVCQGRADIWGVYQLWSWNNTSLGIDVREIISNPEGTEVMVNSLEYCRIWWLLPFNVIGGPIVFLHTVFNLKDTPKGKVFTKQVDHTMWVESLLFHNLPPFVDEFFQDVWRPSVGQIWSTVGNWVYDMACQMQQHTKAVDIGQPVGKHSMHPDHYRQDLARALTVGLCGTYRERRSLVLTMYTEDAEFWHPFAVVKGALNVAGYFQCWCALNHTIEVDILGFIPSPSGDEVMIDMEQRVWPFFWPSFLPGFKIWLHVILYLRNDPSGGKLIWKHKEHVLWMESLLLGNPVGQAYKNHVRPLTGRLFAMLGWLIWHLINGYHQGQPEKEFQRRMANRSGKML